MIHKISNKITCSLVKAGAVPSEDEALYEYGIRVGILMVINVATALLIGLFLGMFWQTVVFFISYSPVRSYSGGYHARSSFACYILSIPLMLVVLTAIKSLPWNGLIFIVVMGCALGIIVLLAPVADPNKPFDELEKTVFRKKALFFSGIFSGAAVILWIIDWKQASYCIVMALATAAALLALGYVMNNCRKRNKTIGES